MFNLKFNIFKNSIFLNKSIIKNGIGTFIHRSTIETVALAIIKLNIIENLNFEKIKKEQAILSCPNTLFLALI